MYKRIIAVVASVLFTLLSFLVVIITDLYDRDFPQAIGVENRLILNFSESDLSFTDAFKMLAELDARWDLGLIKTAPDLARDGDGQIFVAISDRDLPAEFTWFRGDVAKIVGKDRLSHSYPDGFYLVTGDNAHLDEFEDALESAGVKVSRDDASVFDSLGFVVWERGFAAAVLAAFTLIVTLALFWLSLKARGRALRVLGGCPTIRIQVQDLAGFAGALLVSAGAVALLSASYVGVFHGWVYVGPFLKALVSLQAAVIVASLLVAVVMSATSWPSATMLATRQPAVKSLRTAAVVVRGLTFLLVVAAAGPAWSAYTHSAAAAAEMAQWKKLADQVAIVFATDVDEMDHMEPRIGKVVKDAEAHDAVALSYTYTEDMRPSVDFGAYSAVSFVNQRWLDLVAEGGSASTVAAVPFPSVPEELLQMVREEVELLARGEFSEELFSQFRFLRPVDGFRLPVAQGGGGEKLHFADDVLLVVVPSLYETYHDSALTSMASGNNIMFTGVAATQQWLARHGLDVQALRDRGIQGELNVAYIAEEGILLAQFAAYVVWLQNLALVALVVAFTVAVAISAWMTALVQAKRDFPLRLAGHSWMRIIRSRVAKEWLVGAGLVGVVLLLQQPEAMGPVLAAAAYGLLVVPLCHLLAVRWCFDGVGRRRI